MSDARLVGSTTRFGHTLKSWEMDVPWDHNNPNTNDTLTIFAREIVPPKGEELPLLVYLQGGPGFPSPRPTSTASAGACGRLSTPACPSADMRC